MSLPKDYNLSFNYKNEHYDFQLMQNEKSDMTLTINNVTYSLLTNKEQTETAKNILSLISLDAITSIQDLSNRLETLKDVSSIKSHVIGIKALNLENINPDLNKKKMAVENGVMPLVPTPGQPIQEVSIEQRMQDLGVPGVSVAVINKGKIKWVAGYGELKEPTLIQAASISKTITALTILSLIQDPTGLKKVITLDTDVSTLLDEDLWRSIDPNGLTKGERPKMTIRTLLAHTSGTTVSGFDGYFRSEQIEQEIADLEEKIALSKQKQSDSKNIEKLEKRLQKLKEIQPKAVKELPTSDQIIKGEGNSKKVEITDSPGSKFKYSGGGTTILQKIIETATGQDFERAAKERVFDKLDMGKSTFLPKDSETCQGNDLDCSPVPGKWMFIPLGAGGLWTTPEALANVVMEIQNSLEGKGVFDQELVKAMLTAQTERIPNGLGVFVEETKNYKYFFHTGANLGFRTIYIGNTNGQGAVVMTNSEFGDTLHDEIVQSIAKTYKWPEFDSLPIFPSPLPEEEIQAYSTPPEIDQEQWKTYAGKYQFENHEKHVINVSISENKVSVKIDENPPFEAVPLTNNAAYFQRYNPGPWKILRFKQKDDSLVLELFGIDHKRSKNS